MRRSSFREAARDGVGAGTHPDALDGLARGRPSGVLGVVGHVGSDDHVLDHRHPCERARHLERTADPRVANPIRLDGGYVVALESHRSDVGRHDTV
jgi:hypothetical protein